MVVPKITGDQLTKKIDISDSKPDNLILAGPAFNIPQKIDILIGAGHFFDIINTQQYKMNSSGPVYQDTKFGFIVSGVISEERKVLKSTSCVTATNEVAVEDITKL